MWCAWLQFADDGSYSFELVRGRGAPDEEKVNALAKLLFEGLLEVGYVIHLAEKYDDEWLREYVETRGFVGKLHKRIGDFGEVLAGAAICDNEGLTEPLPKLRYRVRTDLPMHLTDTFSVKVEEGEITVFCYTSVKSGVTRPPASVAVAGYKQLLDDAALEHPEILYLISENLYRQGRWDDLDRLERAMTATAPTPKAYRLASLFERDEWREDMLSELEDFDRTLDDFVCYVVLLENMRQTVEASYRLATEMCFK